MIDFHHSTTSRPATEEAMLSMFVDEQDAVGTCKPVGGYTVTSGQVEVNLKLKRDGETVGTKTVTGSAEDLDGVVSQLVAAVAEGCAIEE